MLKKPDAGFLRSKTEGSGSAKKQRHSGPIAKNPGVFDRCPAGATPYRRFSARSLLFPGSGRGLRARAYAERTMICFCYDCASRKWVLLLTYAAISLVGASNLLVLETEITLRHFRTKWRP